VPTAEAFEIVPGSAHTAVFKATAGAPIADLRARLVALAAGRLVIVDTAPGFASALTRAAIGAADVLIVPLVLEPFAADRALQAVDVARAQGSTPAILFVAAMVDTRRSLTQSVQDDLAEQGVEIAASVPRVVAVAESPWRGSSIVKSAPNSPAAAAYCALAQRASDVIIPMARHA
jgi:cellulose biosynthesis protein BcsQ